MNTQQIYAHQGDLIIDRVDSAPVELTRTNSPTVIAGSHEGTHSLPAGIDYAKDGERDHYVRPPTDVQLTHASRHNPVPLTAGEIYHIWPQIERRGDGDQDVED